MRNIVTKLAGPVCSCIKLYACICRVIQYKHMPWVWVLFKCLDACLVCVQMPGVRLVQVCHKRGLEMGN